MEEIIAKLVESEKFLDEMTAWDEKSAQEIQSRGCPEKGCGGPLHLAKYTRVLKMPNGEKREVAFWSLCCGREGCRCRIRPPSTRFLGRSTSPIGLFLFAEFFLSQGKMATESLHKLALQVGISVRTLFRWRQALRKSFSQDVHWFNFLSGYVGALRKSVQELGFTISNTLVEILLIRKVPVNPLEIVLSFVKNFYRARFNLPRRLVGIE